MPQFSIVIPVYNGVSTISTVAQQCYKAFGDGLELVLVNDGSTDDTEAVLNQLVTAHTNAKAIHLARNYGEFNAVYVGLCNTTAPWVGIIDDDGQNPPEELKKLLALTRSVDVVYGQFDVKKHSFFRNVGSAYANLWAYFLLGKPWGLYLGSCKVISQKVIEKLRAEKHPNYAIDSLIFNHTARVTGATIAHQTSMRNHSNYTLGKLLQVFWVNLLLSKNKYQGTTFIFAAKLALVFGLSYVLPFWLWSPVMAMLWVSYVVGIVLFFRYDQGVKNNSPQPIAIKYIAHA